jgi:protein disulfide-isomerase A6
VKVGKVDATVETGLAQRFGIQGFPTLKVFDYGLQNKKDSKAIPYNGERSAAAITSFMLDIAEKADIEPELHELVRQSVFD